MKKQTPKSTSTRKTEQDRSFLKILTFGQDLCKSQLFRNWTCLHNFRVSNEEMDPKIGMYSKNRLGQVRFENFDFLVKVKDPTWSRLFFFFVQACIREINWRRVEARENQRQRMEVRGQRGMTLRSSGGACVGFLGLKFQHFADGSSGVVRVLKLREYLCRFEGLGRGLQRDCGFAWGRVKPFLVLKFLGLVDRRLQKTSVVSVL